MLPHVAAGAQRYEVIERVVAQLTALDLMVDLQVSGTPTYLASPAIPVEDFFAKKAITF